MASMGIKKKNFIFFLYIIIIIYNYSGKYSKQIEGTNSSPKFELRRDHVASDVTVT